MSEIGEYLKALEARIAHLEAAGSALGGSGGGADADKVDGIHAATTSTASKLLALDASQQFLPGGDVFPVGDVVGLMKRENAYCVPQYPFDSALADFAWSAATGYVTPSSVAISNSNLVVGFGAGQGTKYGMLYLTTNVGYHSAVRCGMTYAATNSFMGSCLMDDAADNVVATVLRKDAAGTYSMCKVTRAGGGAYTVTAILSGLLPAMWYIMGLDHYGTEWSSWTCNHNFGVDRSWTNALSTSGALAWTPTRRGILYYIAEVTNATTWYSYEADFYYHYA